MSDLSFGAKVNILLILFKYFEKGCANDSSEIFTVTRVSILFIDHRIDVWELLCTAESFMQCFYLPGESHHVKIPFYLHQWVTVCENTDALHNTGLFMLNNVWNFLNKGVEYTLKIQVGGQHNIEVNELKQKLMHVNQLTDFTLA